MSDQQLPPAGWFPDPHDPSQQRWWDGAQWTEHRAPAQPVAPVAAQPVVQQPVVPEQPAAAQPVTAQQPFGYAQPRQAQYNQAQYYAPRPRPTGPTTPYIWVLAGLPVLNLIGILVWNVRRYFLASLHPGVYGFSAFDGTYLVYILLGFLAWALGVLFAFLDHRELRARGIERPFHWAWAFLGAEVYVIGRSVVVRRRTGTGLTPLWIYIGIVVLVFIVTVVKLGAAVAALASYAPGLLSPGY